MAGLRFNTNKLKWGLVSWSALAPMVKVLMYGAHKYTIFKKPDGTQITGAECTPEEAKEFEVIASGANNWKEGLKYTEIAESMKRHLFAFIEGEDNDPESKLSHVGHILCNAMFLSYMFIFKKDYDDRYIDPEPDDDKFI